MIRIISRRNSQAGFTLIELLVVIAIIALLAAILFPVFSRARENARRTSCQSNEKQMALGLIQYTQDYDERLPIDRSTTGPFWFSDIEPYIKSSQIFRCPSAPRYSGSATAIGASTYCLPGLDTSTSTRTVIYKRVVGLHLSEVKQPARTFMIMESGNFNATPSTYSTSGIGNPWCRQDAGDAPANNPESGQYVKSDIHFDGYNVAFVDGHVKWIKAGASKNWIFDLDRQDTL